MARMLGRLRGPQCPVCRCAPGLDCSDKGKSKRQMKREEKRQFLREIDIELG